MLALRRQGLARGAWRRRHLRTVLVLLACSISSFGSSRTSRTAQRRLQTLVLWMLGECQLGQRALEQQKQGGQIC